MPRVLHVLSQRPSLTGSGITLDNLVRQARAAGWEQSVVVGVPVEDPAPRVANLPSSSVYPLVFGRGELAFPVPGMSDVMPYPSSRFSSLAGFELEVYRKAWRSHLERAVASFEPDLIHSHHVWVVSALLKDVVPSVPVVTHCHATGLRQMMLCPDLADSVRRGCSRNEAFVVLYAGHAEWLAHELGVHRERIHIVGAGYDDAIFVSGPRASRARALLYVGKYSAAKGLPFLLDAFAELRREIPGLSLDVAGTGAGPEADELSRRMHSMGPAVVVHGQLGQAELARVMQRNSVCVLPSFYEGVPLVLVEALACGCRLVATALPGVLDQLAPHLGKVLYLVPLPRLRHADRPHPDDVPAFVAGLRAAIAAAVAAPAIGDPLITMPDVLAPFRWSAVFARVQAVWRQLIQQQGACSS